MSQAEAEEEFGLRRWAYASIPFLEWNGSKYIWKKKFWKFPVFATDCIEADRNAAKGISHPLNYFRRNMDAWSDKCGRDAWSYISDYDAYVDYVFQWK